MPSGDLHIIEPRYQPGCARGPHSAFPNRILHTQRDVIHEAWVCHETADSDRPYIVFGVKGFRYETELMQTLMHTDPTKLRNAGDGFDLRPSFAKEGSALKRTLAC